VYPAFDEVRLYTLMFVAVHRVEALLWIFYVGHDD